MLWLLHYGDGVSIAALAKQFGRTKINIAKAIQGVNSGMAFTRPSPRMRAAGVLPWASSGSHYHRGASGVLTSQDDVLDPDILLGLGG